MNFISKNTMLPDSEQSDCEDPWYLSAVILWCQLHSQQTLLKEVYSTVQDINTK